MAENNQTKSTTILAMDVVGYSAKWTKMKEVLLKRYKEALTVWHANARGLSIEYDILKEFGWN